MFEGLLTTNSPLAEWSNIGLDRHDAYGSRGTRIESGWRQGEEFVISALLRPVPPDIGRRVRSKFTGPPNAPGSDSEGISLLWTHVAKTRRWGLLVRTSMTTTTDATTRRTKLKISRLHVDILRQ